MFPDLIVQQYSSNIISENILNHGNEDGFRYQVIDEIRNHRKLKNTVPKLEGFITEKNRQKKRHHNKKLGEIKIRWKNGQ